MASRFIRSEIVKVDAGFSAVGMNPDSKGKPPFGEA
jgi:hypothetical protein